MQIDFHHGVTYITARLAGFDFAQASVIASAAQYVDDATNGGTIRFDNGAQYTRIASAHKMLDYQNMNSLAAHHVWLPFHFLPGNLGQPESGTRAVHDRQEYLERCVCTPDSHVAREMMADVIRRQQRPYALHRLGIASHVYIDTWAHQGFVGYQHDRNRAYDISARVEQHVETLLGKLRVKFQHYWDEEISGFVGDVLPLGHGAVLAFPDQPYLEWEYTNGLGQRIKRDNPADFDTAIRQLHRHYRAYRAYDGTEESLRRSYPSDPRLDLIARFLRTNVSESADQRHENWRELVATGEFGFTEWPDYIAKGAGSWKHLALGTTEAEGDEDEYAFSPAFLDSDWKNFHDALQVHRLHILNELLPRFGLTAA